VIDGEHNRRPDVIVFVNGLPLAVLEVKNPAGYERPLDAFRKNITTYKKEIPELFHYNFILFETDGGKIIKKMAMCQQYYGVNHAIKETIRATAEEGNRKIGVIWHTQGSGKSLSMVFFTAKIIKHPTLENPTVLVLTDRNDLDNQIYKDNFCKAVDLIPYPKQAESIEELKQKLNIPAGGIVFTTIQKFQTKNGEEYPLLSERRNIVVIADEAHRSQYRKLAGNVRQALPNASFIGFTGTPIELEDRSTRVTFGDYFGTYLRI
jgi:type I restriction enzyme R subunit